MYCQIIEHDQKRIYASLLKGNYYDNLDKVDKILKELASHDSSKVHDRHYNIIDCKNIGLKVVPLEDNQILQDKVLSLYHSYILSIYRLPNTLKFIENQQGQTLVISGQR